MNIVHLILSVVSVVFGVLLGLNANRKRIVIRGSFSLGYWIGPTVISMIVFFYLLYIDIAFSTFFLKLDVSHGDGLLIIKTIVGNGAISMISIMILSFVFEKAAEKYGLILFKAYSSVVPKVFFSTIIIVSCFILVFTVPRLTGDNVNVRELFYNKYTGWIIVALSIWFGIDYGYNRRHRKEQGLRKKLNWKRIKDFWLPLFVCFLICSVIVAASAFFPDVVSELVRIDYLVLILGSFFATAFFVRRIVNPSQVAIKMIFDAAVETYIRDGRAEGKFRRSRYTIEKGKVIIHRDNVVYPGHEDDKEFEDLFKESVIEFEDKDVLSARDLYYVLYELKQKNRDQQEYLTREIEACNEARWAG